MDLVNSNILQRIQSRVVSKEMFNFDTLSARPLLSMLDYSDLDKLYNIASSVRYSGDIHKKLNAIREVMHNRGFRKLAQGTNRIVYSYFEDPSIVIKIATDKVGMRDNPAEFRNQHLLKPFVTKVFEVTPDGVVGEFERVQAITSREEFLSCASDYFDLLNIITKKYIMADVGSKYFMNIGIRSKVFGPVLLDFSYLYEVDCNKLICYAPDPNEPSGVCGGLIDYDAGFNELICTKCGAIYRAQEIAKSIDENKIIRKGRKSKMKVAVNWNNSKKVSEVNLNNQTGRTGIFKPETEIVRPATNVEPVGKLRIATPVVANKVVAVTEEKVEVIKEEEKPVVEEVVKEEEKTIADPATTSETINKLEEDFLTHMSLIHTPAEPKKKDKGLKLKVTNQDGTTTEKAVELPREEPRKTSGVKVKDRHYRNNYGDLPRRSQIQLTAITFEQLKELDFKYSSTDLEYHKMFFRAEHEKSFPSVSVDFDSIPKDKLLLIAGANDSEDVEALKKELEEKDNALITLRKLSNDNSETIDKLKVENDTLIQELREAKAKIAALEADNQKLSLELTTDANEDMYDNEEENELVEEANEFDNDNFSFISGTLQDFYKLCKNIGVEVPDNSPSDRVITFKVDNDNTDFIRDQNGKIICTAWLNELPIDALKFEQRKSQEQ